MTTTKDENNRVREWVIGLPSAADLTPLSHSLISRALSRAFCIPPSSTPAPCSEDVLRASQSTLQLLQQKSSPLALGSFDPYTSYESVGVYGVDGGGDEDRNVYESLKRNRGNLGRNGVRLDKSPAFNKGGWAYGKGQGRDGGDTSPRIGAEGVGNGYSGTAGIGQAYYWSGVSPGQSASLGADASRRGGLEEGVEFTNDANLEKFRKLADTESEDVDSADGPDGNPARTLKRPRLVWTPQLHKRFVDAVGHLGIKNAVPKTIMQLMNVEGLTRENVASHLQKYRLYLKRMQGLSSEGPSSSDPLFASAPLPPNLTSSPHFFGNHHLTRIEGGVSCPFGPSGVPSSHTPGMLVPGAMVNGSMHHFGRFDHHPYNIGLSRSASRPLLNFGDHRDRPSNSHSNQQGSGSPPRHVLSLFPPSGP